MASSKIHLALALVGISISVVLGNPIAAAPPPPSGTCKTIQPCVSRLRAWTDGPSYCSSLLSVTPTTSTTTVPGRTSTTTLPVSTITAPPSTSTTTIVQTVTVCNDNSSQSPAGNQKRATTKTKTTPSPIPSPIQKCVRTNIPKACSCLSLTTSTVVTTVTSDSTVTVTPSPDSTTVTPPAVTETSTSTTTVVVGTGAGTPTVVLTSPTAITAVQSDGNAAFSYDDQYFPLTLPFEIELFGTRTSNVDISVNGWIALTQGQSSSSYINSNLPVAPGSSSSNLPDVVFAPYWNDLFINQGTKQGIYYQVYGSAPNRNISVEWYTSTFSNSAGYYHFITTLQEAVPGAATFSYHQANGQRPGNTARLGTVGVQKYSDGKYKQYSYDVPVAPGLELYYDPATNDFRDVSTVTCPVTPSPQRLARPGPPQTKPSTYPGAPPA